MASRLGAIACFWRRVLSVFAGFVTKKQKKSLFFLTVMKIVVLLQCSIQLIH